MYNHIKQLITTLNKLQHEDNRFAIQSKLRDTLDIYSMFTSSSTKHYNIIGDEIFSIIKKVRNTQVNLHKVHEDMLDLEYLLIHHYISKNLDTDKSFKTCICLIEDLKEQYCLTWPETYNLIRLIFSQQERDRYIDDTESLVEDIMSGNFVNFNNIDEVIHEFSLIDPDELGHMFSAIGPYTINQIRS